jgi:hypothetical protein
MKKKILLISYLLSLVILKTNAQNTITGNFSTIKGETIRLMGYRGVDVFTIDSTVVNAQGDFSLNYSDANQGMGYLLTKENTPYAVVLEKGKVKLTGQSPADASSIVINSGEQNKQFVQYALAHGKREQALSAWVYLKNLYGSDTLFKNQPISKIQIESEINYLKKSDSLFLVKLPHNSFMYWYLPVRKLISDVQSVSNAFFKWFTIQSDRKPILVN